MATTTDRHVIGSIALAAEWHGSRGKLYAVAVEGGWQITCRMPDGDEQDCGIALQPTLQDVWIAAARAWTADVWKMTLNQRRVFDECYFVNCDKIKIDGICDAYCQRRRAGFTADEAEQAIRRACEYADERQIAAGIRRGKKIVGDA